MLVNVLNARVQHGIPGRTGLRAYVLRLCCVANRMQMLEEGGVALHLVQRRPRRAPLSYVRPPGYIISIAANTPTAATLLQTVYPASPRQTTTSPCQSRSIQADSNQPKPIQVNPGRPKTAQENPG